MSACVSGRGQAGVPGLEITSKGLQQKDSYLEPREKKYRTFKFCHIL